MSRRFTGGTCSGIHDSRAVEPPSPLEAQSPDGEAITEDEVEQEADLLRESQEEVRANFLEGPFTEQQLDEKLGTKHWSLTKRFCLYQGEERKIRVIDNYRDSGINSAFSSSSYLALQDTDFIVGLLRFIMVVLAGRDRVIVHLSTGEVLEGAVACVHA